MKVKNEVLNYKDLKIIQDNKMFSFCLDSILLARFWQPSNKFKNILDFGTNNAIIPLIISKYTDAKITGIEIQKDASEIAKLNIKENKLTSQINIINEDIKTFVKDKNNFYDLIFCNPPFFKVDINSNLNTKSEFLPIARHEISITLEEIIISAKIALKNGGRFLIIHLSERLDELIYLLRKNNFAIKKLRIVYSKINSEAKKILIEAENNGRNGMRILNPLYIHKENGDYYEEVLGMFGD